jgi:CHAT domain-containing protein/tetratricopeptide (TPR) repeat protein
MSVDTPPAGEGPPVDSPKAEDAAQAFERRLVAALNAYLNTADRQERAALIRADEDLFLNGAADEWLWKEIARARAENDQALVDSLRHGRLELWRCRYEGIDKGLLPVLAPDSVREAAAQFVAAPGEEEALVVLAARRQDLFTRPADRLVWYTGWLLQDDWPTAHALATRHQVLSARRQRAAQESVDYFLKLAPGGARRPYARTHPELLWPDVADGFAQAAQLAPDAHTRRFLTEALADYRAACQAAGADIPPAPAASPPAPGANWAGLVPAELHEAFAAVRQWEVQLQQDHGAARPLAEVSEQTLARLPATVDAEVRAALHNSAAKGYLYWEGGDRRAHLARAVAHAVESLGVLSPRVNPALFEFAGTILLKCFQVPPAAGGPDLATAERCWSRLNGLVTPARDADHFSAVQMQLGAVFKARVDQDREAALRRASGCYKDALRHLPKDADPTMVAAMQFDLGDACCGLGYGDGVLLHRAIESFRSGLRVLPPGADPAPFVLAQHTLGVALAGLPTGALAANLEQAVGHYEEALRCCTPGDDPGEYAAIQNDLGNACRRLAAIRGAALVRRAITCYEEALRYRTLKERPLERARTLNNLGLAHTALPGDATANLRRAVDYYREALGACPPTADPGEHGRILGNLGNAYIRLPTGDRQANAQLAIAYFQDSLRYRPWERAPTEHAATLTQLGSALATLGGNEALPRAIRYFEAALKIYTRQRFPREFGTLMMNLGGAWAELDGGHNAANLRTALECTEEALAVVNREDAPRVYGLLQMNRGSIYDRIPPRPNPAAEKQAIACYEDALTVFRPPEEYPVEYAAVLDNLGSSYGELDESDASYARAVHCYHEALRFRTAVSDPYDHRATQVNLGLLHFHRRRWPDADAAYRAAIAVDGRLFEAGGAQQVWHEQGDTYPSAAFSAVLARGAVEGLQTLERGQARALTAALRLGVACPAGVPPEVWSAFKAAGDRVRAAVRQGGLAPEDAPVSPAAYAEQLEVAGQARDQLDSAIARVRAHAPDFLKEFDLADVREQLEDGTALVEFCVTSQGSKAFLVTREAGAPRLKDIPEFTTGNLSRLVLHQASADGREGDGWVAGYLLGDRGQWRATMDRVLGELGRALLAPVAAGLDASVKRLVFVGGGLLALLPLHAAPLAESPRECLGDRYEVSYAPSLAVLAQCLRKARRGHGDDWYAVVNPREDTNLPYTSSEAAAIGAQFPTKTVRAGPAGTRAAFCAEAPGRAYVHFSGHGAYEWLAPDRSGLELADARLRLADLQAGLVDLSAARLVSLSACESGLIDVLRGAEYEYVGLPAGFLLAGVPCVVSSLWQVPELSTALLMERFYANHRAGRMTIPAALAAAQQSVRTMPMAQVVEYAARCLAAPGPYEAELFKWHRHYRLRARTAPAEAPFEHPYYWAAFTVNGA